jgi:hypothetical protein
MIACQVFTEQSQGLMWLAKVMPAMAYPLFDGCNMGIRRR